MGVSPSPDLGGATARLITLARLATRPGRRRSPSEASALADRLAEGRFYVACIGQFKRGKSTLLNALVGQPLLPSGIIPITTAVTVLRWGSALRARVRLDRDWHEIGVGDLAAYVSEEQQSRQPQGRVAGRGLRTEPVVGARDVSGRYARSWFGTPRREELGPVAR